MQLNSAMEADESTDAEARRNTASVVLPEVEMYCYLLGIMFLVDRKLNDQVCLNRGCVGEGLILICIVAAATLGRKPVRHQFSWQAGSKKSASIPCLNVPGLNLSILSPALHLRPIRLAKIVVLVIG